MAFSRGGTEYICDWCGVGQCDELFYNIDGERVCPDCISARRECVDRQAEYLDCFSE